MLHSIIKEEDIAEFQYFSESTPESITDKAACFVYFIEKGWANTRAAERCFEFGNEDLVLFLVMKKLRANPDLQDALKEQGVWNDHWERRLEHEGFSPDTLIVQFKWQGIVVEIVYKPRWFGSMAHLEVTTVMPPRSPLPITETGYRSHFLRGVDILSEEELRDLVIGWLDEAAASREWQLLQQERMQLTLF